MATTVPNGSSRDDARAEDLSARQQIIETARGRSDASFWWLVLPLLIAAAGWHAYSTWSGLNDGSSNRVQNLSPTAVVIVFVVLALVRDRLIRQRLDAIAKLLESSGAMRDFATGSGASQ